MKVKIVKYGTDGSVRKIGLRFESGLTFVCTEDIAFCGKEKSDEVQLKLDEIIKELKNATRKDFEAVAEIIKNKTSHVNPEFLFVPTKEVSEDLADYFATQNPRFDRERFLTACGLED